MRITINYSLCATVMLATVLQLVPATESRADFFKYKNDSGALIITNRFEDVPKKYRNRVKVVWDADLEAKDPVARRGAAVREQYERQETAKKAQQEAEEKKNSSRKGKTLVIELDENTGQLIRRFE
jgi:hypothetical protein